MTKKPETAPLLFEIGCEELPATNLADIFEGYAENPLLEKAKKALADKRIVFGGAQIFATPRRLVFYFKDVAPVQSEKETLTRLMSREDAYSNDQPSEKLLTILKHRQAGVEDVVISDQNGKQFAFLKKIEPALPTTKILPEILEAIVKTLGFPKNMRWDRKWPDGSDLLFPRPIRSFLCFYGNKALGGKLAGIAIQNKTFIFVRAERKAVSCASIPAYFSALKKTGVILDFKERKAKIQKLLSAEAAKEKGRLYEDSFLLNEVNFLVENPNILAASFSEEFLSLPIEVLAVSMARKQRIFGMTDKAGKLAPRFLGVLDRAVSASEKKLIAKNFENILHAKLQDSLFFYREDTKDLLEKKREMLKDLIFIKGAGSMIQKSDRLVSFAKHFSRKLHLLQEDNEALVKAAFLCKADLLTQMVGEFPELQGVMGKYYLLNFGKNDVNRLTAEAIGEHYLPRTVTDKLPSTLPGALLSIFDKNDLICACFALGMEPTSSLDPYGLRRSAAAVIKIMLHFKSEISLTELIAENLAELFSFYKKENSAEIQKRVLAFYRDRFKAVMADLGYAEDLTEAVMAVRFEKPYELFLKTRVLSEFRNKPFFIQSAKIIERLFNILKGVKGELPKKIDPALLSEPAEKEVYASYEAQKEAVLKAVQAGQFELATSLYAGAFFDILGKFFEQVFVNTEDQNVRQNRLALLSSVKELYTREVADLSKIRV